MTMDVEATIDPEIAAALALSPMGAIDFGTFTFEAMPAMRDAMANMPAVELPPTTAVSREVTVSGATGFDPTVRVYSPPTEASARPCVYWIHGGGYMFGSGLTVDARINRWVEEFDCVAVSIEYRLAPEHPFPAPLEDAWAGFAWAAANATELGLDPERIAVGGDSAGGNMAAVVSLLARAGGGAMPAMQLLIYPPTDTAGDLPSRQLFAEGFLLTKADMEQFERHYLPEGTDRSDPRISILRAPDLRGLPPAYVTTAGFDPLRDEGEAYAERLREAGVHVALRRHSGLVHSFVNQTAVCPSAHGAMLEVAGALRMGLAPGDAGR